LGFYSFGSLVDGVVVWVRIADSALVSFHLLSSKTRYGNFIWSGGILNIQ